MLPLALLANKWVLRAGAVAVAGLAFWIWLAAHDRKVREDEKEQAGAKWSQQLEQGRAADRKATEEKITQWQGLYEQAQARAAAAESMGRELARAVATIQQQRTQAFETVTRMPDSALHAYIIDQLRLRAPGDVTPCYTPSEERAIAKAIVDGPLCQKQSETMSHQIDSLKEQQAAQQDQITALGSKYDALAGYATRLEATYTTLFNAWPRRARSAKCLWVWKCGSGPKIPTPDPQSLSPKETP